MNISPPPLPHGRQNTPSSPPINTTDTLQITVSYKTRTIALRVNDGPIIADLLPDIARRLGILDPSIVYGGYRLLTSDGDPQQRLFANNTFQTTPRSRLSPEHHQTPTSFTMTS